MQNVEISQRRKQIASLEIEPGRHGRTVSRNSLNNDASIFVSCAHLYSCRGFMKTISLLQIMDNHENVPAATKEAFCLGRKRSPLRVYLAQAEKV